MVNDLIFYIHRVKANRNIKLITVVFIAFLSLILPAHAENWYPVNILSASNGLPTNEVKQVYQDKEGYIWIATSNGLCRYDGYQIKIYKDNLYTPNLLSSNNITVIAEDKDYNIWIGTTNGLNILNKVTGEVKCVPSEKLENNNIQTILATKGNGVWIGTAKGLHRYIAATDSFIYYDNSNTNYSLRGNDIKTLAEDKNGNIWIGTWSEGITRFDPRENTFYPYPRINPVNSAHTIFEDNQNNIWVGSWGYGLFRLVNPYNPDSVQYVNYRHNKNTGSLSDDIVYAISQDMSNQSIWVGTRSGLSILNDTGNPNSFTNHLPNHSREDLLYNEVNSIIRDNSGLMWLGTLGGGVSIVNTQRRMFNLNPLDEAKNKISSNSVRSIYVDKNGVNWLGIGSYGLLSYHPDKEKYIFYEDHPDFRKNPIKSTVYSIIEPSGTGSYWFATYGQGIFIYSPSLPKNKVENITVGSAPWLSNDCVYYLKEDHNKNIWIGTSDGISIYNTTSHKGASYPYLGQNSDENKHYDILCIEESDPGTIWLATSNDGVFRVDKEPATSKILNFHHYNVTSNKVNNDNVLSIYKDHREKLWIGSEGGGLSLYNEQKDIFVCVQKEYNIPGDIVYNIVEDNKGDLWLGTNSGLVVLQFSSDTTGDSLVLTRQYTTSDGLQDNSFNRNAIFRTDTGELYFGGHKGFNHFFPEELYDKDFITPVVITDIKIFNKPLQTLDKKLRSKISGNAPGYTKKISLPYNYNSFGIEFAALDYSSSMQSKYAYLLDGFDEEWQFVDASRRFASYNNLKPGTYNFHIKASVGNGVWNENEPALQVVVLTPFWLTWWAFLIYFILVTFVTYFIVKITHVRMLLKNEIRVKDIEKQKIEELNHAKLQFFTNITHEFLTPLTILSASVDELKMISPQHDDFYAVMSNNLNRLIRLFQQILEFRKAETGNLKLKVSKGDIARFVGTAVDSFKPVMKKKKMHFSLLCDPESITAYFDPDKLDKILYNLLSNASKYNKQGGFIQVNVHYDTEETNSVVISVKDNGAGIQEQAVKGLFKRFYEGDYRRFNTIGTGIGLSLVKDLVELHKGEISVESEPGIGTTFVIKVPVNREAYIEEEIDDYNYISESVLLDEINIAPANTSKKSYSLLIIEDNEDLLQLMVKLLGREYNVFVAQNGKEGIDILEHEYIDLAISDIMMPEMDGIEFCKYVKNKFEISHVPVILLTAKNKEEDKVNAYDSGADGFISKPFNLNVLHSRIKNLLKSKEKDAQEFKKKFVFEIKEISYTSIDEDFLNRAVKCVREHIDDTGFDQQQFADAMGTSKSTLYKKLKSLVGLNTSSFIRSIRLKTACKIIEEKKKIRISELAYTVGFNDPKYFSACFKKEYGLIPSEYLDQLLATEDAVKDQGNE